MTKSKKDIKNGLKRNMVMFLCFFLALFVVKGVKQVNNKNKHTKMISDFVQKIEKQLPKQVDINTMMTKISSNKNRIYIEHSLITENQGVEEFNRNDIEKSVKEKFCYNPKDFLLYEHNPTIYYYITYRDTENNKILNFTISQGDCRLFKSSQKRLERLKKKVDGMISYNKSIGM